MDAKFEEKTFEGYLNNELDQSSKFFFPLGQVQEGVVGADAAFYSMNPFLWYRFGYRPWEYWRKRGRDLREIAAEMEDFIGRQVKNIPSLQTNLLFQYKRPEYISMRNGKEWSHWGRPYFRYDIDKNQQSLLSHLSKTFNHTVLVLYAAPAIQDVDELVKIKNMHAVVKNTNFTHARRLDGHDVNTYIQAGSYSIACSEPERIDAVDIFEVIASSGSVRESDNGEFLAGFGAKLIASFREAENVSLYQSAFDRRIEYFGVENLGNYQLFKSHLYMSIFSEITGVRWLCAH